MLKPTSTAVMLVISTGRRRSTRMSTSGWSTFVSTHTQNAARASPPSDERQHARRAPAPRVGLAQARTAARASATDSSAAPSQSTFASGRVSSCGT